MVESICGIAPISASALKHSQLKPRFMTKWINVDRSAKGNQRFVKVTRGFVYPSKRAIRWDVQRIGRDFSKERLGCRRLMLLHCNQGPEQRG